MSHATQAGRHNRLLLSLPSADAAYLASIVRLEQPAPGRVLTSRSVPADDVWFPHDGVIALNTTDAGGRSVQTGLIGSEGCVGLEALFDRAPLLPDAVVQIGGVMSVIRADQLRSEIAERPAIQAALSHFLFGLSAQSLQTIACNRLHSLLSRCCRWLLTLRDRVTSDELALTQEGLAALVGSGRPRINSLLGALEKNGLVLRHRGRIRLIARAAIEAYSCECYRTIRLAIAPPHLMGT